LVHFGPFLRQQQGKQDDASRRRGLRKGRLPARRSDVLRGTGE
jgi:hypothetical protein